MGNECFLYENFFNAFDVKKSQQKLKIIDGQNHTFIQKNGYAGFEHLEDLNIFEEKTISKPSEGNIKNQLIEYRKIGLKNQFQKYLKLKKDKVRRERVFNSFCFNLCCYLANNNKISYEDINFLFEEKQKISTRKNLKKRIFDFCLNEHLTNQKTPNYVYSYVLKQLGTSEDNLSFKETVKKEFLAFGKHKHEKLQTVYLKPYKTKNGKNATTIKNNSFSVKRVKKLVKNSHVFYVESDKLNNYHNYKPKQSKEDITVFNSIVFNNGF